jgi:predicted metalloprotease with PDZ domain
MPARTLNGDMSGLLSVSAHEFFHLWNVKRIRPRSLEPVDYTKENYTSALWFSEGVDSTVGDYILLRAGLLDEPRFLVYLGEAISELEDRPAHLTQSAEQSSLDAWLEKYPYYGKPERSISYYNKGELLGVLLDLRMRAVSHDQASLQALFRWMYKHYAQQKKFFPDSDGVRQSAETISGTDLRSFFADYVSGVREIPWDEFFAYVGLHITEKEASSAEPGFDAVQKFDRPPIVVRVEAGSAAERAGLLAGDVLVQINGHDIGREFMRDIQAVGPGGTLQLVIQRDGIRQHFQWTVGERKRRVFEVHDLPNITAEQKAHRALWLFDGAAPTR